MGHTHKKHWVPHPCGHCCNLPAKGYAMFSWVTAHSLGPAVKFRWLAWLGVPRAGPALRNYPAPPYSRRINTIRQERQCVTCVTNFWILIISIHTSRFGNRIKQIWQPLLFINGYLHMEYTLFQDFARKIPCLAPPTGRPGRAQSGCTPKFGYGPLVMDHTYMYIGHSKNTWLRTCHNIHPFNHFPCLKVTLLIT